MLRLGATSRWDRRWNLVRRDGDLLLQGLLIGIPVRVVHCARITFLGGIIMKCVHVLLMLLGLFSHAGSASELKFVLEAEQANWWTRDKLVLGPGLGQLMKPDLQATNEIAYTIQSDGTPANFEIVSKSDPSLSDELLFELVRLNHYVPARTNSDRVAIRTSSSFKLGGSNVPAPVPAPESSALKFGGKNAALPDSK